MRKENLSDLKAAVFTLLYDQYDINNLDIEDSDEAYINAIKDILVSKNEWVCPFKNYNCECYCSNYKNCNKAGNILDCGLEPEFVWFNFMNIKDENL